LAKEKRKTETNKSDSNLIDINEYKPITTKFPMIFECTKCNKTPKTIYFNSNRECDSRWLCESCLKKILSKQKVKVILV